MLVVNGGAGRRVCGRFSTSVTRQGPEKIRSRSDAASALAQEDGIDPLFQAAGRLVEIFAGRHPLSGDRGEGRRELRRFARAGCSPLVRHAQVGGKVPIRAAPKGESLELPFDQKSHGDRLHPPGRKPAGDLFPEERAQRVTVEPVEHPAGFLGLDQVGIELCGCAGSRCGWLRW